MINKKRINKVEKYIAHIPDNEELFVITQIHEQLNSKVIRTGFSNEMINGEVLLPRIIGTVSRFNAEGGYIRLRDLPKETYHTQREWTWTDWSGAEHSKIVDIPHERYQRKVIPPPAVEIQIIESSAGVKLLLTKPIKKTAESLNHIKHVINLFLECFGECDIYDSTFEPRYEAKVVRLNWEILPPGEYPWEKIEIHIENVIAKAKTGNQPVIRHRFKKLKSKSPDFVAIGNAGFDGYVIFGFTKENLYIFESNYINNATYVFENDWTKISIYSKAEILTASLQKDRLIHVKGWETKIDQLLK